MPQKIETQERNALPHLWGSLLTKKNGIRILAMSCFVLIGFILIRQTHQLSLSHLLIHAEELTLEILLITLSAASAQFFLQCLRSWVLFSKELRPSVSQTLGVFSWGQVVNMIAPMRSGDLFKIALLKQMSGAKQGSLFEFAGVLTSDKLVDILSLILLVILSGAELDPFLRNIPIPPIWLLLTILGAVLVLPVLDFPLVRNWTSRVKTKGVQFLNGLSALKNPEQLIFALAVGMSCWVIEGMIVKGLCSFFDYPISFGATVFALTLLNLGIAVPISLANLGVFEAALALGLTQSGIPFDIAIVIAATHHIFQILGVALWFTFSTLFLRNRPADATVKEFQVGSEDKGRALAYYDQISGQYDRRVSLGFLKWFRQREKQAVLSLASLHPPARTLIDVGCGGGFYSLAAKQAGFWVTSVDAATGMVESLRGKVDEVQIEDIESFKVDRQFDRVLCLGVLDFVLNPEQAIINLCQLVAPGGRLILFVPRSSWAGWAYRLEKKQVGIKVNLFEIEWIQTRAEREGLKLKEIKFPLPTNMVLAFDRP